MAGSGSNLKMETKSVGSGSEIQSRPSLSKSFRNRLRGRSSKGKVQGISLTDKDYIEQIDKWKAEHGKLQEEVDRLQKRLEEMESKERSRKLAEDDLIKEAGKGFHETMETVNEILKLESRKQVMLFVLCGLWIVFVRVLENNGTFAKAASTGFVATCAILLYFMQSKTSTMIKRLPTSSHSLKRHQNILEALNKDHQGERPVILMEEVEGQQQQRSTMVVAQEVTMSDQDRQRIRENFVKSLVDALTPEEMKALEAMREIFKTKTCIELRENIGTFILDDACLLRFLRARDYDIKKARAMLETHLEFRDKFVPAKVQPSDIAKGLASGLTRRCGYSVNREPIILVQVRYFNPSDYESTEQFIKTCAYFFELSIREMDPDIERGEIFFDMAGFSLMKHGNAKAMRLIAAFINIVQDHNPERLSKLTLFNVPGAFRVAWKVIKGFIDPNVVQKIDFISDLSPLRERIDPKHLNIRYGGEKEDEYPIHGIDQLTN